MHQQRTTSNTSCACSRILPPISAALLLMLLLPIASIRRIVRALIVCTLVAISALAISVPALRTTIAALLLRIPWARIRKRPLPSLLIDKQPTVIATVLQPRHTKSALSQMHIWYSGIPYPLSEPRRRDWRGALCASA